MDQSNPFPPPEGTDRARHRGIFSRSAATADAAFEAEMASYQQVLEDRLEQGLAAINQSANALMHEIASEVWRAAGGDKDQVGSQILESLSRDQAIRSLVAHSDERFQDLYNQGVNAESLLYNPAYPPQPKTLMHSRKSSSGIGAAP